MPMQNLKDFRGFDNKGWICDTCGEVIERAEYGWVQWLSGRVGDKRVARDLQLVHQMPASPRKGMESGCQFDQRAEFSRDRFTISDSHLMHFLGDDGLMTLLAMLMEERLPRAQVVEMIERLHIPGYEHARFHFDQAIAEGVFEPNTLKDFYWQSNIKAVNNWAEKTESIRR